MSYNVCLTMVSKDRSLPSRGALERALLGLSCRSFNNIKKEFYTDHLQRGKVSYNVCLTIVSKDVSL